MSSPHQSSTSILAAGASKVLKKSNSVVLTLGKLTKAQVNLANLIRALSTLSAADAVSHDYVPFKAAENSDITDCDQCGGDLNTRRPPHKCKICGLVVHDSCRQLVSVECATAGSMRLSYRFYQETLLPYGAYNNLLRLVSFTFLFLFSRYFFPDFFFQSWMPIINLGH